MARRTFDVTDVMEILVHWYAGRSQSEIRQGVTVGIVDDEGLGEGRRGRFPGLDLL